LHHGDSNQANVTALVEGYKANNIPVGAVNIDSEWETYFNNFEVDTKKFSDFPALIEYLHGENLHVTMWTTSMVDSRMIMLLLT
jgi:alpha-glucosidase (family GH31 glycosyl hydrolase)